MSTAHEPPATPAVDARRRRFVRPLLIAGGLIVLLPVLIAFLGAALGVYDPIFFNAVYRI